MEEQWYERSYLPKPVVEKKKPNLQRSILSIVLFAAAFYFFFGQDWQLVLTLVVVVFIHEMGHLLAMKAFGYQDVQMLFIPFFGAFVSGDKQHVPQWQKAVVTLAGPMPGIFIGLVLFYLLPQSDLPILLKAANIFLFLNVFNLLPVNPLDGGRLIEAIFFSGSRVVQLVFSLLSAVVLLGVGIYFNEIFMMLFGGFMLIGVYNQYHNYRLQRYISHIDLDLNKDYEELTDEEYWKIREEVIGSYPSLKGLDPSDYNYAQQEPQIMGMVRGVLQPKPGKKMSVLTKLFFLFVWFLGLVVLPAIGAYLYYIQSSELLP